MWKQYTWHLAPLVFRCCATRKWSGLSGCSWISASLGGVAPIGAVDLRSDLLGIDSSSRRDGCWRRRLAPSRSRLSGSDWCLSSWLPLASLRWPNSLWNVPHLPHSKTHLFCYVEPLEKCGSHNSVLAGRRRARTSAFASWRKSASARGQKGHLPAHTEERRRQ